VELHPQKTRIVHVQQGFEFLGYKIKRGQKKLRLPESKIRSQLRRGALYAYPREKSIRRFMDQVRPRTKRNVPLKTKELIEELNPLLRGWGEYYKRAHVRRLFHRLDGWIVRLLIVFSSAAHWTTIPHVLPKEGDSRFCHAVPSLSKDAVREAPRRRSWRIDRLCRISARGTPKVGTRTSGYRRSGDPAATEPLDGGACS
jgi:hypothetical protein